MSKGHIQLISQLEKSHKKLGVVLIWRVGTLRTAAAKQQEGLSPHAWPIRSQWSRVTWKKRRADGTCDRQAARWEEKSWHYSEKAAALCVKSWSLAKSVDAAHEQILLSEDARRRNLKKARAVEKLAFTHAWHLSRASWILHRDRHRLLLRRTALQRRRKTVKLRSWTCHLSGGVKTKVQTCLSAWNPSYQRGRRTEVTFPQADVSSASCHRGQNTRPREDSISPTQRRWSSETKTWTTGVTNPSHPLRVSMEVFFEAFTAHKLEESHHS